VFYFDWCLSNFKLDYSGYNNKHDVPEKLEFSEDEMSQKREFKEKVIYKQVLSDLQGDVFEKWIKEQLEYQDHPPGFMFFKESKHVEEIKVEEKKEEKVGEIPTNAKN
jgi:hypothetical protein